MKKVIASVLMLLALTGCGSADSTAYNEEAYNPYYAYISMPDGTIIEGETQSARMWQSGMVKVEIDGVEYLTGVSNILLIRQ